MRVRDLGLREYVSDELVKKVDRALGQLRLGQVSAESEASKTGKTEPNDLDRIPAASSPAPIAVAIFRLTVITIERGWDSSSKAPVLDLLAAASD